MVQTNTRRTIISKSHSSDCEVTVLTQRYNSFHIQYIPKGITLSLSHIHQVFDNSHAPTHLSSWLGLLDAASSDSIIRRRPAERGRVRTRQKRAQPQQGISKTSRRLAAGRQLCLGDCNPARENVLVAKGKHPSYCTQKCWNMGDVERDQPSQCNW